MRKFSRQATVIALQAAITGIAATAPVFGDSNAPTQLPDVVVTADWLGAPTPESAKTHPGARTVVTQRELTESGARTIEDALRNVPGVSVLDESGTGILPNIGVRGLNPLRSEQVLVLVDGIPVTLAPYGQTGLSLFPLTLNAVEAIDVARGGVAVHYGPNNVGGVVNFITKRIPRKSTITAKETLSLATTGNVLRDTYLRAGGFVADTLGLQLQANTIGGKGERDHSDTAVRNVMLDGEWLVTERSDIKFGLQYYKTDNDLPGALTPQAYEQDRTQSTRPLDRFVGDTTRGHVIFNRYFDNGAEFSWTNFAHRSSRQFFFGNATNASTPSTAEQSSPREFWVYASEPKVVFDVTGPLKQKIALGTRFIREEVDYKVDSRNLATGAFSVSRDWRFENDAYAAYASDTLVLLGDRLKITPGVRAESVRSYYRNNVTGAQTREYTSDWLPGLDIGYQATDRVFMFANYQESLRPVQFTQITFGGDLEAERADNYEIGTRWAATRHIDLGATAFRFDFDNKLEFVNATVGFRNLGKARHEGVETEARWRPEAIAGLELKAAYTYVDTEQLSGQFQGKELPFAPHQQWALQSNYRAGRWNWNLNGQYQSEAFSDGANTETENASGSAGKIPSYWLWNAQLTYHFSDDKRPGAKAALAVNNLFDRDYYFRGVDFSQGRMPAPGRAVLATVQIDW